MRAGQASELRFTAFKMRDTPRIEGRLLAISADSLKSEKDEAPYYLARVLVTPAGLELLAPLLHGRLKAWTGGALSRCRSASWSAP